MSAVTIEMTPRVRCDHCGGYFSGQPQENSFDLRSRLRGLGWRCGVRFFGATQGDGNLDECPTCERARTAGEREGR